MGVKDKKVAIEVDIWYLVSGYKNGMIATGSHCFYYLTDSYGQAYNKALEDFEAYYLRQTKDPSSHYYGLDYTMETMFFEKRILD